LLESARIKARRQAAQVFKLLRTPHPAIGMPIAPMQSNSTAHLHLESGMRVKKKRLPKGPVATPILAFQNSLLSWHAERKARPEIIPQKPTSQPSTYSGCPLAPPGVDCGTEV
jgi:hypothetical protein